MRRFLLILALTFHAVSATAQSLTAPFDPQGLSRTENRILQTALAFAGAYNGLLDGAWGGRSLSALSDYARDNSGTAFPRNLDAADAIIAIMADWYDSGWEQQYWEVLELSFLTPDKTMSAASSTALFVSFDHLSSSLAYSLGISNPDDMRSIHSYVATQRQFSAEAYSLRKPDSWVTSARLSDGRTLYARSERMGSSWSNILLSAAAQDKTTLMAVAASITRGNSPSIYLPEGSFLSDLVTLRLGELATPTAEPPDTKAASSSGTGFYVSDAGHVLTNAHVVKGCARITFNGKAAELLDASEAFDLAILRTDPPETGMVAGFATTPARLNSDVTVVGYPLSSLLGGINVTRGAVSSLKGVGGDATRLQITAPVQAGNSGGPVLAANGAVVGVVVSKLDSNIVSASFGDVPQNVNFAIRGEVAKLYLAANSIQPVTATDAGDVPPEVLADTAVAYTGFIQCY